jgi:hypothetical protein
VKRRVVELRADTIGKLDRAERRAENEVDPDGGATPETRSGSGGAAAGPAYPCWYWAFSETLRSGVGECNSSE